jgi:hypothetical protein
MAPDVYCIFENPIIFLSSLRILYLIIIFLNTENFRTTSLICRGIMTHKLITALFDKSSFIFSPRGYARFLNTSHLSAPCYTLEASIFKWHSGGTFQCSSLSSRICVWGRHIDRWPFGYDTGLQPGQASEPSGRLWRLEYTGGKYRVFLF